ncbi:ATP-dependent RNA helicase, mitochondrial [Pseudocercospora fuligena]|uniref:ATP-dependent RNA helicase n=1 Tax=Pseudocercospora fuligena TaxID=685502 RepID=A0A8H6RP45_9PEZI|nr:ATP-dependent RNA helicase, mitochondrial [Pseudocercospora fuligena]
MRRAFQRCSALQKSLSTLPSSAAQQCFRRIDATRIAVSRSAPAIRSLHQSSIRRQELTESATPLTKFADLGSSGVLHDNVVRTLTKEMGLETMTEVQTKTINEALKGQDVIAQAKTGTGKTLAFLLPILQRIIQVDPELANRSGYGRRGPRTTADDIRALIISPTRELAEQIAVEAKKLTKNTGVIVQTAVGGTQKSAGLRAIQRDGCHVLVATPGRLKDLLTDPYSRVEAPDLSALVFDEADRLLDQGFWPDIQEIMTLLPTRAEKDRQTLMFSATVPREVVSIVRETLKPGFNFVKCVRDDEEPTHARIAQKSVLLSGLENCVPSLIELCERAIDDSKTTGKPFKAIVYFNSTAEVTLAASALLALPGAQQQDAFGGSGAHPWHPTKVLEIHAKLTQNGRTRASDEFRKADSAILLSSDVTARGMDFPNVSHVIQVGLPSSREQYIHRIGRTGRAGKEGEGWIFLNAIEAGEARTRLRDLPLTKDDTLLIPKMDLTQPADVPASAGKILSMYQKAIKNVPMAEKAKVYLAQLGVYGWFSRKQQLVDLMNRLARFGWGLSEPPRIPSGVAQRLRLSSVQGLNIGDSRSSDRPRQADRFYRDRDQGDREQGGRYGGRGGQDRYGGDRGDRRSGYDRREPREAPRRHGDAFSF